MFHGLIQVASIKSFSCCHATTTLIQISTAKLSFLSSEVLDTTPWILLILSHGLCSAEIVVADKKQKKRQFNDTGFSIIIHDIIENLTCSSSLFFFKWGKAQSNARRKKKKWKFHFCESDLPFRPIQLFVLKPILPVNNNSHFSSYWFSFCKSFLAVQEKKIQASENTKKQTKRKSFSSFSTHIQLTKLDTPDNSEWDAEGRSESEKAYFHLRKSFLFPRSSTPDWWALNYRVPQKGWEMPTST